MNELWLTLGLPGVILVLTLALLLYWQQRWRLGHRPGLRPIAGYHSLTNQTGEAVESGRQLHVTLGQGSLAGVANPTSVAALTVLDYLAAAGCASATPPLVSLGEGTLLPAAQDSLLAAYRQAQLGEPFPPGGIRFVAPESDPVAYAAGVTGIMHQERVSNNVLVGRFGSEVALMAMGGMRTGGEQIIGSDDPQALALATAFSRRVLVGEELLASGAYLQGGAGYLAQVQTQDVLRLVAGAAVIGVALVQLIAG